MFAARCSILAATLLAAVALSACANIVSPPARFGMVKDPDTGLQFGSVVDNSLVTDASFHKNRRLKVRLRNTSGDAAFDLKRFAGEIEAAFAAAGYEPTRVDDFGLLVNVNVVYSGQVQTTLAEEFAFLGAAAGGIAGFRSDADAGTAIGTVAGATLGSILGSYVTDDTYIIVARVSVANVKGPHKRDGKTITFSRSISGHVEDEEEKEERRRRRRLGTVNTVEISVYAGGRNVRQAEIAEEVRRRFVRIIGDII